jgi:hypothetical protein
MRRRGATLRPAITAVALLLATVLLAPAAAAGGPQPGDAAHLAQEALREFQLGHWAEAMALFQDSFEKRPSAKVQRGIAKCMFELRMYVRALGACDRALAEPQDPLPEELADDVRALRARALRFTSEVVLDVTPAHAKVAVDGQSATAVTRLDLGTHTIRVDAEGYDSQVSHVEIVASAAPARLRFDLRRSGDGRSPEAGRPSPWLPLVGGVGAALATTVAAVYVADRGAAIDDCETLGARGSGCANVAALERERAAGITATVLGAGALVVCGYFFVRAITTPSAPSTPSRAPLGSTSWQLRF